jgi:hypothetical protein
MERAMKTTAERTASTAPPLAGVRRDRDVYRAADKRAPIAIVTLKASEVKSISLVMSVAYLTDSASFLRARLATVGADEEDRLVEITHDVPTTIAMTVKRARALLADWERVQESTYAPKRRAKRRAR